LVITLNPLVSFSDEFHEKDKILHFDQPIYPLTSLSFKHTDELKPTPNDFHILEVSYLSNTIGERWAIVTIENKSNGQRLLKNDAFVATFADGFQSNSYNLNEALRGNERLTKAIYFGIHQFPIVSVTMN